MDNYQNNLDLSLLGSRLEQARHEQHLTREALSKLCHVSPVHIRHMEIGLRLPSLPVFISLCNALKVSPSYFLADYIELRTGLPDAYDRAIELLRNAPPHIAETAVSMIEVMDRLKDE